MNISQDNTTILYYNNNTYVRAIVISCVCSIPSLLSVFIAVVSFKSLVKECHALLMFAVGVCDSLLNLSYVWRNWINTISSMRVDIWSCLMSTSALAFSAWSAYMFIFVLCLERYLTVRSFNFGTTQKFNRYKYVIIVSVLICAFLLSLTLLIIPFNEDISKCTIRTVYGEYSFIYFITIASPATIIVTSITITTLMTAYNIWKVFFRRPTKNKIHPIQQTSKTKRLEKMDSATSTCIPSSQHANNFTTTIAEVNDVTNRCKTVQKMQATYSNQTSSNKVNSIERGDEVTTISNDSTVLSNTNDMQRGEDAEEGIEIIDIELIEVKDCPNIRDSPQNIIPCFEKSSTKTINEEQVQNNKHFEVKAFVTTILIGLTTVCLTSPFIVNMWISAFTSDLLTRSENQMLLLPLILNTFIDNALIAWCLPEIRERFTKLCRRA